MDKRDLRKCEVQSLIGMSRGNTEIKICYFHKWFDGINEYHDKPAQFAVVENEDGTIEKLNIENYRIRFIGQYEGIHKKIEEMLGSDTSK